MLVREGVVKITREGIHGAVRLGANERVVVEGDGRFTSSAVDPDSVARKLAWQQGMIAFEGTSLGEAAEDFARYGDPRIAIDDPSVAKETISGMFSANNPQGFAHAVALSLNLNSRTEGGKIHLGR